jgi:LysR family transcriptional regulator, low CO2-responsive transcriptional regulator
MEGRVRATHAQLRAFHAVAATGSFTRAARALSVTQPSVSSQVKGLEDAFGVRLFERVGRGVRLTPVGTALLDVTDRYFNLEQEAVEVLKGGREMRAGRLAIAADSTAHIVAHLGEFARRFPKLGIAVRVGNSQAMLASLRAYESDIAVVADLPPDAKLHAVTLRRDPVVALVPSKHGWTKRRQVRLKDLSGERLVLREAASITRKITEEALAERGIRPQSSIEMDSREAVCEAVAAGLGVALISEAEVPKDRRLGIVALADARLTMTEHVVCLAERKNQPAIRAFFELVAEKS